MSFELLNENYNGTKGGKKWILMKALANILVNLII